jgi:maltooligosyltrehalose synthase
VVVVGKWLGQLMKGEQRVPTGELWQDTFVALSEESQWRECLTGSVLGPVRELRVAEVFKVAPVAVLVRER